jgi:hypothetical protein
MSRARWGRLLAVLVVAGAVLVPAAAANAATLTACVKKRTGEMRLRQGKAARKKCPKGWKKVRWNVQGAAGKQGLAGANGTNGTNGTNGAPGPMINLKDATGAIVGQLLDVVPEGLPVYTVWRDGAIWYYLGDGHLFPLVGPRFKASDCSGTAYLPNGAGTQFSDAAFQTLISGPFRAVYRIANAELFGTPTAYAASGATEPATAIQLYSFDNTGACNATGGPVTGTLFALQEVPAPPDFTGPLTIG